MTARARVEHNFIRDGVSVWLGRTLEDGAGTELYLAGEFTRVLAAPGTTFAEPSLFLSNDLARALYAALGQHFGDELAGGAVTDLYRKFDSLVERVDLLEKIVQSWNRDS